MSYEQKKETAEAWVLAGYGFAMLPINRFRSFSSTYGFRKGRITTNGFYRTANTNRHLVFIPFFVVENSSIATFIFSGSFVATLFKVCSPFAIRRLVVTLWVNAVNRVFRGRLSAHIFIKVQERIHPSITNSHASPTVVLKTYMLRLIASFFHFLPCYIFWGFYLAMKNMCSGNYIGTTIPTPSAPVHRTPASSPELTTATANRTLFHIGSIT